MDDGQRYRDQSSQPVRALLGRRRRAESPEVHAAQVKTVCTPSPAASAPHLLHAPTTGPSVCKATRKGDFNDRPTSA